jgi:hypothetical protein
VVPVVRCPDALDPVPVGPVRVGPVPFGLVPFSRGPVGLVSFSRGPVGPIPFGPVPLGALCVVGLVRIDCWWTVAVGANPVVATPFRPVARCCDRPWPGPVRRGIVGGADNPVDRRTVSPGARTVIGSIAAPTLAAAAGFSCLAACPTPASDRAVSEAVRVSGSSPADPLCVDCPRPVAPMLGRTRARAAGTETRAMADLGPRSSWCAAGRPDCAVPRRAGSAVPAWILDRSCGTVGAARFGRGWCGSAHRGCSCCDSTLPADAPPAVGRMAVAWMAAPSLPGRRMLRSAGGASALRASPECCDGNGDVPERRTSPAPRTGPAPRADAAAPVGPARPSDRGPPGRCADRSGVAGRRLVVAPDGLPVGVSATAGGRGTRRPMVGEIGWLANIPAIAAVGRWLDVGYGPCTSGPVRGTEPSGSRKDPVSPVHPREGSRWMVPK